VQKRRDLDVEDPQYPRRQEEKRDAKTRRIVTFKGDVEEGGEEEGDEEGGDEEEGEPEGGEPESGAPRSRSGGAGVALTVYASRLQKHPVGVCVDRERPRALVPC